MNFKKFISGISALTIAASAFAGMAVTASAANPQEIDYIGTSVAVEEFGESYTVSGFSNSRAGCSVKLANNDDDYYLDVPCSGTSGSGAVSNNATYSIGNVTNGTVNFNAILDFAADYAHSGVTMAFIDSDNNVVASLQYKARGSGADRAAMATNSAGDIAPATSQLETINTRTASNVVTGLSVDLVKNTFKATVNTSSYTAAISENSNIAALRITVSSPGGTSGKSNHVYFDDVAFYTIINKYDVTATDSASATVSADVAEAAYGDTVTVTAAPVSGYTNAVITVTGVTSGDTIPVDANGQFTMPAENVTVTATATEIGSVGSVTIIYQLSNGTVIGNSEVVSLAEADYKEGDSYTYAIPTYVVSADHSALYKSSVTDDSDTNSYGSQQGTLTATDSEIANSTYVDVSNAAYDAYYFEDFNDTTSGNHMARMSMGMSANGNKTFTVPEAGVYDIEVRGTADRADGSNRAVVVRGSNAGTLTASDGTTHRDDSYGQYYAFTSYGTNVFYTAVELTQGETLTLSSNGKFDYILLKKRAIADPTASATWVQNYTELENGANGASVWALTITPGSSDISKIGLKLNGAGDVIWANSLTTTITGSSSTLTFAAVINKIRSDVTSLAAYFNNDADNGITVTID